MYIGTLSSRFNVSSPELPQRIKSSTHRNKLSVNNPCLLNYLSSTACKCAKISVTNFSVQNKPSF